MTKYGKIIARYRKLKGLTQSQLAEQLFISPQAVSKWENDQSEPDLTTIKKLTEIFGITVDQFFLEEKDLVREANEEELLLQENCVVCLNSFDESKLVNHQHSFICKDCFKEISDEEEMIISFENNKPNKKGKFELKPKTSFFVGLGLGLLMFVIFLLSYLAPSETEIKFSEHLLMSIIFGILSITFITQMLYDSWLKYFLMGFFGKTIGVPGLIFELSIDGFIWFIIVKVLLGLFVLAISLAVAALGILIAVVISPVTYIIELVTKLRKGFDYELV